MPLTVIRGEDQAPLEPLRGRQVAVIGYGNQGRAHALNLRDSGLHVVVANRPDSANGRQAVQDGFPPVTVADAAERADLVILAAPDETQSQVYHHDLAPHLRQGATLGFLHGFNIRFGRIKPRLDLGVIMIAPKGPGATLRQAFEAGRGIPCLFALHQENPARDTRAIGLAWAHGIGCARAGIILTTFADEADTDLFGEQAVLCGGMTYLVLAAFETLVQAGYPPELAYLECCHEVKQIADLVQQRGLAGMMKAISNTAEFGAHVAGPELVDDLVRERMKHLLDSIRDGHFAAALAADYQAGFARLQERRAALGAHPIDAAGRTIRALMPWLSQQQDER